MTDYRRGYRDGLKAAEQAIPVPVMFTPGSKSDCCAQTSLSAAHAYQKAFMLGLQILQKKAQTQQT